MDPSHRASCGSRVLRMEMNAPVAGLMFCQKIQEQSEIAIESHDDSSLSTPSPRPKSDQPAGILIEDLEEESLDMLSLDTG